MKQEEEKEKKRKEEAMKAKRPKKMPKAQRIISHLLLGHSTAEAWPLVVEETKLSNGLQSRQAVDPAPLQWRQERLDIGVDGAPRGC